MRRDELAKVYRDTVKLVERTTSANYKQSEKWSFDDLPPTFEDLCDGTSPDGAGLVEVIPDDTLNVATDLIAKGWNPLVLNMACVFKEGGGVTRGAGAQEEEIFRRTNYNKCANRSLYPMKSDEFIVTEGVTIVKDDGYNVLHDYLQADFIAMAAPRKPALNVDDGYYDSEDEEIMRDKIDALFRYAAYQGYDSVVFGALGCGAYGNPPKVVRDMFQVTIDKYRKFFELITFAVLERGDSNYSTFKELK